MSNPTGGSGSPNFQMDVIFSSLRELQQEKERLQQHFNGEKSRCRSLEIKLEACQSKHYQSIEKHCKMLETVNAAKQKVLQTQLQATRLKELNDGKSARIAELRRQICEVVKKEDEELKVFENKLADLTSNFRDARNYYTEENVRNELEQWSRKADETKAEVFKEDKVLKDLTDKFNQLQMENKKAKDELNCKLEFDITSEELQIALRVFEEMNQKSKDDLKESEKQLEEELERIKRGNDTSGEESVVNKHIIAAKNSNITANCEGPSMFTGCSLQAESNQTAVHGQLSTVNPQYFRLDSRSSAAGMKGPKNQIPFQQEARKSSLQGRSFFLSLPVSPKI